MKIQNEISHQSPNQQWNPGRERSRDPNPLMAMDAVFSDPGSTQEKLDFAKIRIRTIHKYENLIDPQISHCISSTVSLKTESPPNTPTVNT